MSRQITDGVLSCGGATIWNPFDWNVLLRGRCWEQVPDLRMRQAFSSATKVEAFLVGATFSSYLRRPA